LPRLTDHFYNASQCRPTRYYVETGSYRGDGIDQVLDRYEQIHSIELSEPWYQHCCDRFKNNPNVHIHFGNSKTVLPELLATMPEPVTVYLDAHYSAGTTAYGDEDRYGRSNTPLLRELEILQQRAYDDIIIIDDTRLLGGFGCVNGGGGNEVWPSYLYDWTDVTEEEIWKRLKPGYRILKQFNHTPFTDGPWDQWVAARLF
jgi:hypothetical protein